MSSAIALVVPLERKQHTEM